MSFIRCGSRLGNGARSGAYVYGDGELVNVHLADGSARRRGCGNHVRLTYEEVIAIARSCVERGWVPQASLDRGQEALRSRIPEAA